MNNTKRRVSCPQLTKLTLILTLLLGWGSQAWGETWKLSFESKEIPEGWTGSTNTYSPYAPQYKLSNGIFEPASSYQTPTLTSDNAKSITSGQKIVIKAKTDGNTSAYVSLKKSATSSFSSSATKFEASKIDYVLTEYTTLIIDDLSAGDYYFQFQVSHASIESIELVDSYDFCFDENNPMYAVSGYKTCTLKYTAAVGWNTIMLPFAWSDYKNDLFGEGLSFYELSSYADNTLTFSVPNYNIISANKPYLVYAPNAKGSQSNITVNNKYLSYATHNTKQGNATFQGTYAPKAAGSLTGNYGITSDGMLRKAGSGATMKGYRAYFTGLGATEARIITIDEDGTTTDLGFVKMVDPEAKDVYNLQGQKVEKGRKGIYVVNGKKVVIK